MKLIAAFQFLTTIPIPKRREVRAEDMGAALAYFPLVGLCLGAVLAGVNWTLGLILPSSMVNVFIILALLLLTGALHVDGFIDTCDALFGQRTPSERWQILSDSRVGSFGVIGAFCLLLLVYVSLGEMPEAYKMVVLILMPALSRWSMVYAIFAFPYAKPEGLGKAFKQQVSWKQIILATLLVLASTLGLLATKGLALVLVGLALIFMVWLVATLLGWFLKRRFAGLTGDSYGAINEVTQVFILIFFCVILKWVLI